MKLIIAGSRDIHPRLHLIDHHLRTAGFFGKVTEIVSGGARGVDKQGESWAREAQAPVKRFEADWKAYGQAAGPIRNKQMAHYADAALIFFDREPSPGSSNMLAWMVVLGKPFHVVVLTSER